MKGSVHVINKGKRYTDDFKKMIVELYNSGKPAKEICEEYGVTYPSISNWALREKGNGKPKIDKKPVAVVKTNNDDKKSSKSDQDEILRLKKEIDRIAMENEILKKAIAIFSKDKEL